MTVPSYAFIGGGNMGRALIGGLIEAGQSPDTICVVDPVAASRETCAARFGIATAAAPDAQILAAAVVVLAVKPQQLREVALAIAPDTHADSLYLSIAAGITTAHLEAWLGHACAIVRCMPNTPALIGRGAAALYANAAVNNAQRALASDLLGAVGSAHWVADERLMDAVTAVSGSGPAYFFLFIELLEKIGGELGLPAPLARDLALETALGAAALAADSELSPAALRVQVTSPGGTTEQALARFAADNFEQTVRRALTAARDRSLELAQGVNH